jgi:ClpP class serine protease
MINPLIIQEVFEQPLCIENGYAMSISMAIASKFFGTTFNSSDQIPLFNYVEPYAVHSSAPSTKQTKAAKPGSLGVITIDSPIVENSDPTMGIMGTREASRAFQAFDADPSVSAHFMVMNSGGGATYAIKPLRDTIKARTKPLIVFSDKIIASAAYGLIADADYIIMYHPQGIVGSFGTMSSSRDMQPMFEKWGMQFNEYYATLSTLKNKTSRDAKNGDPKALRKNVLDPINEDYLGNIKIDRGDKISSDDPTIYQGETYLATKALELGLIDAIGPMSEAMAIAFQLGGSAPKTQALNLNSNMKLPKLFALAGKAAVTQAEMDQVNAELVEAGFPESVGMYPESVITESATVTAERNQFAETINTLTASLETANTTISTLTSEKGTLTTENSVLKAKLAKGPAAVAPVVAEEDPELEVSAETKTAETIASLGHNQGIVGNPLFYKSKD